MEKENMDKLTSKELAELVIDGLVQEGIIKKEDYTKAVESMASEIELRKFAGDY